MHAGANMEVIGNLPFVDFAFNFVKLHDRTFAHDKRQRAVLEVKMVVAITLVIAVSAVNVEVPKHVAVVGQKQIVKLAACR